MSSDSIFMSVSPGYILLKAAVCGGPRCDLYASWVALTHSHLDEIDKLNSTKTPPPFG